MTATSMGIAGDPETKQAKIEHAIGGQTLVSRLKRAADECGDTPALSWQDPSGAWVQASWANVHANVHLIASGLVSLGLQRGDRVALMAPNIGEHVLIDQGVVHAGGLPFTVYATSSPDQVAFMAADGGARFAVLHGQAELNRWQSVLAQLPALQWVIVIDPKATPVGAQFIALRDLLALGRTNLPQTSQLLDERCRSIGEQDPVALVYTSGTTGDPKGVVLTHRNVLYKAEAWRQMSGVGEHPVSVSYLPYAHIAERVNGMYTPIHLAGHVHFCPTIDQFPDVLAEVRPHSLTAVPRIWEKLQGRLTARLQAGVTGMPANQVATAADTAREYLAARAAGVAVPSKLTAEYQEVEHEVLAPLRRIIGLDRSRWCASSAAPADEAVAHYFAGLGVRISSVYGMTETAGGITGNPMEGHRRGTVGKALPGCEAHVADDGELLVRGPLLTPGYFNNYAATAALIDEAGWAHTGDLASMDTDGYITIVGRKKELIVTSGGENIPPRRIEELLEEHPAVSRVMACGDGRRYVTALIAITPGTSVVAGERAAAETVERANARLARAQQVKKWWIVPDDWSVENGELTPTLKLRRTAIASRYAAEIDEMYDSGNPVESSRHE